MQRVSSLTSHCFGVSCGGQEFQFGRVGGGVFLEFELAVGEEEVD